MIDIIIDIETLGTRPGCIILEIGACAMNPHTGEITANFSRRLDEVFTRHHEVRSENMIDTISWWHGQSTIDTYCTLIRRGHSGLFPHHPRDPKDALGEFCDWFAASVSQQDSKDVRVWANGPSFDISILQACLDRYGIGIPWVYWQERCVRTALEMACYERDSVTWIERGPRHRALNDARHEARKLFYSGALGEVSAIMRRLKQRGTLKGVEA